MHIRIAHFRERQYCHTGGGLSWGSAGTPTEGKFWERRSCTRAGGAKLDPGLAGPQQARRSWLSTLLPCHLSTQAPSWASVLHTKTLPPLTVPQRWRREYVPSQPRSWALWTDLLTGRLRGPKLQGQALLWSWSLVNSQWEWEPEERGEMVSDSGSQPFHTGLLI